MELKHFEPVMKWWNDREEINKDGFDKAKKFSVEEIIAKNYNIDLCGYPHEEEEFCRQRINSTIPRKRASLMLILTVF